MVAAESARAPEPSIEPPFWRRPVPLLLAAVLVCLWPCLLGDLVYDDELTVARNTALLRGDLWQLCTQPFHLTTLGYWRPLASLVMWAGYASGGVAGIHAVALALHAGAAVVAFRCGRRLLGDVHRAWLAAACFALHPLQVESVAWCSASSGTLSGLLVLLAADRALAWRARAEAAWPIVVVVVVVLALLAKESGIVAVPLVLAVVRWGPGAGGPPRWGRLLSALALGLSVWWAARSFVLGDPAGGVARLDSTPDPGPLAVAGAGASLALRSVARFVPTWTSTLFEGFDPAPGSAPAIGWLLAFAAIVVGLAVVWRRLVTAARLGAMLLALPVVAHVATARLVGGYPLADRYLYVAACGFGLLLGLATRRRARWLAWSFVVVCGGLAFRQSWVWHDQASFVAHATRYAPDDATAWVLAGDAGLRRVADGDLTATAAARAAYERAMALADGRSEPHLREVAAAARIGRGWCLLWVEQAATQPDVAAVVEAFRDALRFDDTLAAAWIGFGVAQAQAQRPDDAERAFRKAIELEPTSIEAWHNLGYLQAELGQVDAARASLAQVLWLDPGNAAATALLQQLR